MTLYISTIIIDSVLEGVNFAKSIFIVSSKSDIIASRILSEIGRGVTALKGIGMYTNTDKDVLFCVLHRTQIPEFKFIIQDEDPNAFIIFSDTREVLGEGFKTKI